MRQPRWLIYSTAMSELSPDQRPEGWSELASAYDEGVASISDPPVTFDKPASVAPPLAHRFGSLDATTLASVKDAFVSILREQMGDGPYGTSAEANIAIGVK